MLTRIVAWPLAARCASSLECIYASDTIRYDTLRYDEHWPRLHLKRWFVNSLCPLCYCLDDAHGKEPLVSGMNTKRLPLRFCTKDVLASIMYSHGRKGMFVQLLLRADDIVLSRTLRSRWPWKDSSCSVTLGSVDQRSRATRYANIPFLPTVDIVDSPFVFPALYDLSILG